MATKNKSVKITTAGSSSNASSNSSTSGTTKERKEKTMTTVERSAEREQWILDLQKALVPARVKKQQTADHGSVDGGSEILVDAFDVSAKNMDDVFNPLRFAKDYYDRILENAPGVVLENSNPKGVLTDVERWQHMTYGMMWLLRLVRVAHIDPKLHADDAFRTYMNTLIHTAYPEFKHYVVPSDRKEEVDENFYRLPMIQSPHIMDIMDRACREAVRMIDFLLMYIRKGASIWKPLSEDADPTTAINWIYVIEVPERYIRVLSEVKHSDWKSAKMTALRTRLCDKLEHLYKVVDKEDSIPSQLKKRDGSMQEKSAFVKSLQQRLARAKVDTPYKTLDHEYESQTRKATDKSYTLEKFEEDYHTAVRIDMTKKNPDSTVHKRYLYEQYLDLKQSYREWKQKEQERQQQQSIVVVESKTVVPIATPASASSAKRKESTTGEPLKETTVVKRLRIVEPVKDSTTSTGSDVAEEKKKTDKTSVPPSKTKDMDKQATSEAAATSKKSLPTEPAVILPVVAKKAAVSSTKAPSSEKEGDSATTGEKKKSSIPKVGDKKQTTTPTVAAATTTLTTSGKRKKDDDNDIADTKSSAKEAVAKKPRTSADDSINAKKDKEKKTIETNKDKEKENDKDEEKKEKKKEKDKKEKDKKDKKDNEKEKQKSKEKEKQKSKDKKDKKEKKDKKKKEQTPKQKDAVTTVVAQSVVPQVVVIDEEDKAENAHAKVVVVNQNVMAINFPNLLEGFLQLLTARLLKSRDNDVFGNVMLLIKEHQLLEWKAATVLVDEKSMASSFASPSPSSMFMNVKDIIESRVLMEHVPEFGKHSTITYSSIKFAADGNVSKTGAYVLCAMTPRLFDTLYYDSMLRMFEDLKKQTSSSKSGGKVILSEENKEDLDISMLMDTVFNYRAHVLKHSQSHSSKFREACMHILNDSKLIVTEQEDEDDTTHVHPEVMSARHMAQQATQHLLDDKQRYYLGALIFDGLDFGCRQAPQSSKNSSSVEEDPFSSLTSSLLKKRALATLCDLYILLCASCYTLSNKISA